MLQYLERGNRNSSRRDGTRMRSEKIRTGIPAGTEVCNLLSSSESESSSTRPAMGEKPDDSSERSSPRMPELNSTRVRNWVFTWNNYPSDWKTRIRGFPFLERMAAQQERGHDCGTPHIQGLLIFRNKMQFRRVRALFNPDKPHIERMKGTPAQAWEYCTKKETREHDTEPFLIGIPPKGAGHRSDLDVVAEKIKSGTALNEIAQEHPTTFIKFNRGMFALRNILDKPASLRQKKPNVIVYFGATNTGKTYTAQHEAEAHGSVYNKRVDDKWWCGYLGEKSVILNEYQGQLPIATLLNLWDEIIQQMETKGGHVYVRAERYYVTSNVDPREWYSSEGYGGVKHEQKLALFRRIDEVYEYTGFQKRKRIDWSEYYPRQDEVERAATPPGIPSVPEIIPTEEHLECKYDEPSTPISNTNNGPELSPPRYNLRPRDNISMYYD